MTIASYFALDNQPKSLFRCVTPSDDEGTAKKSENGIFPQMNNQFSSIDDQLAMFGRGRRKEVS